MKVGTISLDLDNLWCYQRSFGLAEWQSYSSFLDIAIPRILSFLEKRKLLITFFIVGKDASNLETQKWLRLIVDNGHEVANHSFHHEETFHKATHHNILTELSLAHNAIEQATGQAPIGFRGPAFGLSEDLLSCLFTLGYQYDASTFPNSLGALARKYQKSKSRKVGVIKGLSDDKFGTLSKAWAPLSPYYIKIQNNQLLEIPVTTSSVLRFPCHGTYLNYLADKSPFAALCYFKMAILGYQTFSITPSFLLHATDFLGADDNFDLNFLPGMQRSNRAKISFMHEIFDSLQKSFDLLRLGQFCEQFGQLK
jgi:hypothetical protein